MIFAGCGTGAIDKLIGILGLRIPAGLDDRYHLSDVIPADERPVMFIVPFEPHSNELPWRELIADAVVVPQHAAGHIDTDALEHELDRHTDRRPKIGSLSAASTVTSIVSDTHRISALLHPHAALSLWDFAAAAPTPTSRCTAVPTATHCPTKTQASSARTSSSAAPARSSARLPTEHQHTPPGIQS